MCSDLARFLLLLCSWEGVSFSLLSLGFPLHCGTLLVSKPSGALVPFSSPLRVDEASSPSLEIADFSHRSSAEAVSVGCVSFSTVERNTLPKSLSFSSPLEHGKWSCVLSSYLGEAFSSWSPNDGIRAGTHETRFLFAPL